MQQIKKSHHVPSCNRIKNETLLRSFSLIVIFNFRFALIALQLLPVNPLPPVNQLAIFLQINWLSNCLQTLFWRSRTSANMMINQPKIKTEILSYSDIFFFSLTQHWIMKRMADITTRWWAFGPTSALWSTFLSHKGPLSFSSPPDQTIKIDHSKYNPSNSLGCFYSIPSTEGVEGSVRNRFFLLRILNNLMVDTLFSESVCLGVW